MRTVLFSLGVSFIPSCLQCAPSEVGLNSEPNPHWNQLPFSFGVRETSAFHGAVYAVDGTTWSRPHDIQNLKHLAETEPSPPPRCCNPPRNLKSGLMTFFVCYCNKAHETATTLEHRIWGKWNSCFPGQRHSHSALE